MSNEEIVQVSVEGVDFIYGQTKVLSDISFRIKRGDFCAIIGPNGSGKTTLLNLILGILQPKKGEVKLFGKDMKEFSEWERIGYVRQNATHIDPFFPTSVKEVTAMGLLSRKRFPRLIRAKDNEEIEEALKKVDMLEYKNRRIGELSGGQQQRVFIARAVVNQPEIIFLDEPTTGVDATTQKHFYEMLHTFNKEHGITIILITHDIGVITKYVTKVACLNQKLIFHGTHEEFCRSSVVEEFLKGEQHLICHRH